MKKRSLCLFLALVLVLSLVPAAMAQNEAPVLQFRRMSFDGVGWYEDTDTAPLEVLDAASFGTIGYAGVIRPYCGDDRLSEGVLTSSDSDVIQVNQLGTTFDFLPFYEVVPKSAGTATLTYRNETESCSVTINVVLPTGFFTQQSFDPAYFQPFPIDLEACTDLTVWFMTEEGLTETEANAVSITFGSSNSTKEAVTTVVQRPGSTNRYDIQIVFQPDEFIREAFIPMRATLDNEVLASINVSTRTMGKVAYGFSSAQSLEEDDLLDSGFCIGDCEFVWFVTEQGLTKAQADSAVVTAKQDGVTDMPLTVTAVPKQDAADRFDLKIDVDTSRGVPQGWVDYTVSCTYDGSPLQRQITGRFDRNQQAAFTQNKEYMIFFSNNPNNGGATTLESIGTSGTGVYGEGSYMQAQLTPHAYVWSEADNAYTPITDGSVILSPQRIWIDAAPYFGNPEFLSLQAGSTRVAELTGSNLPTVNSDGTFQVDCYGLYGYQNTGNICMTIEVLEKKNDNHQDSLGTVTIKAPYRGRVVYEVNEMLGADSTTADVNALLQRIAEDIRPGQSCTVTLAAKTYPGTIVIPEKFYQQAQKLYLTGQDGTVVEHIDLNGAYLYGLSNIDFRAPDTDPGKALYNGYCLTLENCRFRGYDIACDSSASGHITPFNCLFVDNTVALQVDIANADGNMNTSGGHNNMFLDNGTAVLVKSLNDNLDPYHYRISQSNFISNDTDFDIQAPGRFYFYHNFYGKWKADPDYVGLPNAIYEEKHDQLLSYTAPRIKGQDNDTKIYTNFRWKYPLSDLLQANADIGSFMQTVSPALLAAETLTLLENYLTADWEQDTVILNDQADSLTISADVIDTAETTEEITVLNEQEQVLGTWTFE